MRLISISLLVLQSSASLILLTGFLKVGVVVLIVAERVAVVTIYVAEVPLRRLSGGQVGGGAGEVVGIDVRHHPLNVCEVAILPS